MKEKTYVADIDRTIYDIRNDDKDAYHIQAGLTEDIVRKISDEKDDPVWMRELRMKSLQIYRQMQILNQWFIFHIREVDMIDRHITNTLIDMLFGIFGYLFFLFHQIKNTSGTSQCIL